ncbi:MAG TPA: tetratricopeptide repeat protein, partial [Elusimicrobiota bacterium]|nr:tetratricopeptide repeat protein [Elusimicrobiota bacterium]
SPGFRSRGLQGDDLYRALLALAVQNIRRHPVRYASYCLERLRRFWGGLWFPVLLCFYALMRNPGNRKLQAAFLVAASFIGYAVAGGLEEYRVSVMPVLYVLGGCGLATLARDLLGRRLPASWNAPCVGEPRVFTATLRFMQILYAAMVVFLCLELSASARPGRAGSFGDSAPIDAREIEVLRMPAVSSGVGSRDAEIYVDVLAQQAAALRRRGDAELSRAYLKEALSWTQRSVQLKRGAADPQSRAALARAYMRLTHLKQGAGTLDRRDMRAAFAADPEMVCREALGVAGVDLAYFDDCLKRYPGDASLHLERGLARFFAGRRDEARRDFHVALKLKPALLEDVAAQALAARTYPRLLEALNGMDAVESDAPDAEAKAALVLARPQKERLKLVLAAEAAADPAEACRDSSPLLDRSRLAPAYFDDCLKLFPGEASLHLDRGVALYQRGRRNEAVSDFREALRLRPDLLEAAVSLASALQAGGDARGALDALENGLKAAAHRKDEKIYGVAAAMRRALRAGPR